MACPASIPAKRRYAVKKPAATATSAGGPTSQKEPPLSQQAYERIKGSILSFELRPGLFINETN